MYNHHIVDVVNRLLQTTLFHQCTLPKVAILHVANKYNYVFEGIEAEVHCH